MSDPQTLIPVFSSIHILICQRNVACQMKSGTCFYCTRLMHSVCLMARRKNNQLSTPPAAVLEASQSSKPQHLGKSPHWQLHNLIRSRLLPFQPGSRATSYLVESVTTILATQSMVLYHQPMAWCL